jgi:CzcA family heavy metal efflux pump
MTAAADRRGLMRWIVASSLKFRYLVVLGAVGMMVFGVTQIGKTRVDVFPEFAPPQVEIQTLCLGLSTSDVESLVTVPIEQVLNGINGLDDMRSKSVPQLSDIVLIFRSGTDVLQARQLVQERLQTVVHSLPTWASPPVVLPPVSATSRVMQIGMTSRDRSLIEMSMTAYWTIRARLLRVPGVANVAIWGERLQQMQVQVDPARLRDQHVSLDQVMETVSHSVDSGLLRFSSGQVIGSGGALATTAGQQFPIQHILPIVTPADLAKVPVARDQRPSVPLGRLATVMEGNQPLAGDAIIGGQTGLLLVVEKLPWGNTLQISRDIDQAINELRPGMRDITFDTTIFRQSTFINVAIHDLRQSLVLGFLLVAVILALFLFEWRVVLVSLLTIPLSLMAALLVLRWRGATLNTMTLAGFVIALGAVVDDAIIDIENILRRLREHRREGGARPVRTVILDASLEVRGPIVYATLIIVAAAIPIFLLQGLTGAFFQPLAVSYTLAISASMLVALTVTPALVFILLSRVRVERHQSPLMTWLQRHYTTALKRVARRPHPAYAAFTALSVAAVLAVPHLGQSLFPQFKERDFLIHWITTPGTSDTEMERITIKLSDELRAIPGVRTFGAHIGQAFLGEEIAGVNFGEDWISIDPKVNYDQTLTAIRRVVDGYPGIYRDVLTYLNERIEEVLTGSKEPVVVRIYGSDLNGLRGKADEIGRKLSRINGITDEHVDLEVDQPQIQVQVNTAKAARYGLKPGDIRRAAATLVAGEEVGDIFRNGRAFDTVVWSTPPTRNSVYAISELPIDTPSGTPVRLGEVANVTVGPVPNLIERENDSRRIDVLAAVQGRDLGSVIGDVRQALAATSFPRGYHAEVLGDYLERQAAQNRMLQLGLIAALAILLLLHASFGSWRQTLLIFCTLPLALVGGVLAALLGGGIISLGSLVGFFTVFGIAARNGILLVDHFRYLQEQEHQPFGLDLVLRGARERLSPILMTSLATGLALVPLVVLGDQPGQEIEFPLAIVVLGGLLTSTLLNLFAVPSLYLRFARPRHRTTPGDST